MKNKKLIAAIVLVVAFLFVPGNLKIFYRSSALKKVDGEAQAFAQKYQMDGPHNLGTTEYCTTFSRTKFGITAQSVCSSTTAMLYYSKVTARGQTPTIPYEVDYQDRQYQYVYYADNLKPSGSSTYIAKKYLQPTDEGIGGQWVFSQHRDSGINRQADVLFKNIEDTLIADKSPGKDLPSPSQALANGKAPLVIYYTRGYCDSPDFLILDQLCILPKYTTYKTYAR